MTSTAALASRYTPRQWRALLAGFTLMLLSGLVNGWSIFVEPIEAELRLLRQDTALVFTISLSVSIGGQMLAGFLSSRVQSRYIYWIIGGLSLLGFWGTSRAGGIGDIYLFYGVGAGLAIGMIYNLVLTCVTAQFETGTSFVSGVLLMGFGVGPLILGTAAAGLMGAVGWRSTFAALGLLYAALLLIASFLIPSPPRDTGGAAPEAAGTSTAAMLRSRPYQYFFLWCVFLGATCLVVTGHSSLICRDIGAGVATASLMTGLISTASGVTRPLFGAMADRLGAGALKALLTAAAVCGAVTALAGYAASLLPVLAVGYILLGVASGGAAVYICAFLKERFGTAHYGMNMAVTNLYMILGSVLGTALAGGIHTRTGSYLGALAVTAVYAVLSALFARLLSRADRKGRCENGTGTGPA